MAVIFKFRQAGLATVIGSKCTKTKHFGCLDIRLKPLQ